MITFKIPRIASKPTKPKDEQSSATIPVSQNTPDPVASHVSKPVSPPMQQDTAVFPSSKDRTEHAAGTAASKKPTRPLQKKSIRDVAKISKALISKQLGKADTKKTVEDPVAPEPDSPVPSRLASRAGSVGSSPFDGGAYDKEERGIKGSKDKKMDAGTVGSTTRVAAPL